MNKSMDDAMTRKLIFIPTFNEAENVGKIYKQIQALALDVDIVFLDDNSPDGTGRMIDDISRENPRVFTIHRAGKQGIGSAHQAGIRWAYERGYSHLITMDCDFSHSPEYLKNFIELGQEADVVVGSRYLREGSLREWNTYRKILTCCGHFLTRHVLGMPYDATGAYRLYRLDRVPAGIFSLVRSRGYSFFFESLYALHVNKIRIKEFPIHLPGRTYGHSKMSFSENIKSLWALLRTYVMPAIKRSSYIYAETYTPEQSAFIPASVPYVEGGELNPVQIQGEWDQYWTAKSQKSSALYDGIAVFYRKCIIRPILNHFIKKHFARDSRVLHAGCGSGQVDRDVVNWMHVTALDISLPALNIYRRTNGRRCRIMHGDIFNIPAADESFDGVYNLGVMEHFTHEEIKKILNEFNRVLKPDGRMVLFVPPEFGLSVRFLKGVHFVLNRILKKNIQLHPAEISRVQSKEDVRDVYVRDGFQLVDEYFGIRDLFTCYVIVLQKTQPKSVLIRHKAVTAL